MKTNNKKYNSGLIAILFALSLAGCTEFNNLRSRSHSQASPFEVPRLGEDFKISNEHELKVSIIDEVASVIVAFNTYTKANKGELNKDLIIGSLNQLIKLYQKDKDNASFIRGFMDDLIKSLKAKKPENFGTLLGGSWLTIRSTFGQSKADALLEEREDKITNYLTLIEDVFALVDISVLNEDNLFTGIQKGRLSLLRHKTEEAKKKLIKEKETVKKKSRKAEKNKKEKESRKDVEKFWKNAPTRHTDYSYSALNWFRSFKQKQEDLQRRIIMWDNYSKTDSLSPEQKERAEKERDLFSGDVRLMMWNGSTKLNTKLNTKLIMTRKKDLLKLRRKIIALQSNIGAAVHSYKSIEETNATVACSRTIENFLAALNAKIEMLSSPDFESQNSSHTSKYKPSVASFLDKWEARINEKHHKIGNLSKAYIKCMTDITRLLGDLLDVALDINCLIKLPMKQLNKEIDMLDKVWKQERKMFKEKINKLDIKSKLPDPIQLKNYDYDLKNDQGKVHFNISKSLDDMQNSVVNSGQMNDQKDTTSGIILSEDEELIVSNLPGKNISNGEEVISEENNTNTWGYQIENLRNDMSENEENVDFERNERI